MCNGTPATHTATVKEGAPTVKNCGEKRVYWPFYAGPHRFR